MGCLWNSNMILMGSYGGLMGSNGISWDFSWDLNPLVYKFTVCKLEHDNMAIFIVRFFFTREKHGYFP